MESSIDDTPPTTSSPATHDESSSLEQEYLGKEEKISPIYHVVIIVLGDIGRSPRMEYHTLSLLQEKQFHVTVIGYNGSPILSSIQDHPNATILRFDPYKPSTKNKLLYLLLRFLGISIQLIYILLLKVQHIHLLLVQNPPCIPLLFISFLASWYHNCHWMIDWHNLGYTMFESKFIQKIARIYEKYTGPLAHGHLCVSNKMKEWLLQQKFISNKTLLRTLYDCPPNTIFERGGNLEKQHEFLTRFCKEVIYKEYPVLQTDNENETLFTLMINDELSYKNHNNRPLLFISSTSYTPDEDFSILLEALKTLDPKLSKPLLVVVTGKGPLKEYYQEQISKLKLKHVYILTPWLTNDDYPILLSCADIGISLHTSTSNLDLPMKIVDMFGVSIPVLAKNYAALNELVKHNVNGFVFEDSTELMTQMHNILQDTAILHKLKLGIPETNWDDHWKDVALPLIWELCNKKSKRSRLFMTMFIILFCSCYGFYYNDFLFLYALVFCQFIFMLFR